MKIISTRRTLAVLPFALLGLAQTCLPQTSDTASSNVGIGIESPRANATVLSQYVTVRLKAPASETQNVHLLLDGADISGKLHATTACTDPRCEVTTSLDATNMAFGSHTLLASVTGPGVQASQTVIFNWQPAAQTTTTGVRLPATLGFSTVQPGGGSGFPWIGLYNNALDGTNTGLPAQGTKLCGEQQLQYQILVLDRTTLEQKDFQCAANSAALNTQLKTYTEDDLVVAGTSMYFNTTSPLDTTPIGGSVIDTPGIGYMIIGVGGAAAGQATETTQQHKTEPGKPYNVELNGVLAKDGSGYYDYHPSDNLPFSVSRASGAAQLKIGNRIYQAPTASSGGFWLLKLQRGFLIDPESASDGCFTIDGLSWFKCGRFFNTGNPAANVASQAMKDLGNGLSNLNARDLIFLISTGTSAPVNPSIVSMGQAGLTIDDLGGSGYALYGLTGSNATFTLISSSDPTFQKSVLQGGNAVLSSSYYSSLKQTGSVYGVLSRDRQNLYRPVMAVQGEMNSSSFDLDIFRIAWTQPVAWPKMDTPGRVGAYRYLSYMLIQEAIQDPSVFLDDIRGWYTNVLNTNIAAKADVTTVPFPGGGSWTYGGTVYTFSEQDLIDEKAQVKSEIGYLRQCITYMGNASTGMGLGGVIAGSSGGAAYQLIAAAQNTTGWFNASNDTVLRISSDDVMRIMTAVSSLPGIGPISKPLVGLVQGFVWGADALHNANSRGIPGADGLLRIKVADLATAQDLYINAQRAGFNQTVNAIYSDWPKLSTVGINVAGKWNVANQNAWDNYLPLTTFASSQYFYTQLGGVYYQVDFQTVGTDEPWLIGSYKYNPTYNPNTRPFWRCTAVYPNPGVGGNWIANNSNVTAGNKDLIYLGGALVDNDSGQMYVQQPSPDYLTKMTSSSGFGLPLDLLLAKTGPFSRRGTLPSYGGSSCSNIGHVKY